MPSEIININEAIKDYVRNKVKHKYPNIDTSDNSPFYDLFIGPHQAIFSSLIDLVNSIEMVSNLNNAEYISEEELDMIGYGNYFIERLEGTKATGEVILSFDKIPENGILIYAGFPVYTKDKLKYTCLINYSFTLEDLYEMYNPSNSLYEIPIMIEAESPGEEYNIGEGEINLIDEPEKNVFSGLISVANMTPITGGTNKETNARYAERIKQFYISRVLGTNPGYKQYVLENYPEVKEVVVVGYGDPLMDRDIIDDRHIGGKVDIYIRGTNTDIEDVNITAETNKLPLEKENIETESILITNLRNSSPILEYRIYNRDNKVILDIPEKTEDQTTIQWEYGDSIKIEYQHNVDGVLNDFEETFTIDRIAYNLKSPLSNIVSIYNQNKEIYYELLEGTNYSLSYDNEISEIGTSKENVNIEIPFIEDEEDLTNIENGETIVITYNYNKTINDVNNFFDKEENRVITTDILIKEATPIYIYIGLDVKLKDEGLIGDDSSPDFSNQTSKESIITNAIINFLNEVKMNSRIEESDIIGCIYNDKQIMSFLQYIKLPLTTFCKSETIIPYPDPPIREGNYIELGEVEYPVLYICQINFVEE